MYFFNAIKILQSNYNSKTLKTFCTHILSTNFIFTKHWIDLPSVTVQITCTTLDSHLKSRDRVHQDHGSSWNIYIGQVLAVSHRGRRGQSSKARKLVLWLMGATWPRPRPGLLFPATRYRRRLLAVCRRIKPPSFSNHIVDNIGNGWRALFQLRKVLLIARRNERNLAKSCDIYRFRRFFIVHGKKT